VSQDVVELANVKKVLTVIPVRRPNGNEYIRVHPGDDWQLSPVAIIEDSKDRGIWLVHPELHENVKREVSYYVTLRLAVNRDGVPFLWMLKLSRGGRPNSWNQSAMEAAEIAIDRWVRVQSDQDLGQYVTTEAQGILSDPKWPDLSFGEILNLAFKDRIIRDYDHPLLRQLRGEI
jgi:hypothetical protein